MLLVALLHGAHDAFSQKDKLPDFFYGVCRIPQVKHCMAIWTYRPKILQRIYDVTLAYRGKRRYVMDVY